MISYRYSLSRKYTCIKNNTFINPNIAIHSVTAIVLIVKYLKNALVLVKI